MDESERWRRNLGRQSSIKDRWPHDGDKPSDPSKSLHSSRSGFKRESGSDSQDGSRQEQSYHHGKSKTGELYSSGVSAGSKVVVPAHVRTTQSTTRPKTTPCVQEIPQPTPINVTPTPPSGEQPSTTRPYVGKHSATQSQAYTSSGQRSVKEHVVIKSRPGHAEGRHTSEGAPTSPTSPGLPSHLTVGGHTQPPTTADYESMAVVSMSEVLVVEKQEEWVDLGNEAVLSNMEGAQGHQQTQFPSHKPKVETGKDLQTLEARVERYRQERNEARSEVKALQKQLEQSVGEAERGGSLTAQYERKIQQLKALAADTDREHKAHIERLKKEFEDVLNTQKTEGYQETSAYGRTFGKSQSSSVQQVEATYQAQLYQKEKELRDKENDFTRRQNHYLAQISQLEAARDEAARREGEAQREVERMKMEHHSQLHRLPVPHAQTGSMTDSSLEEDSRCPSNRIFCQPSSADGVSKVVMEGWRQGSVKLEDVQRAMSKEPIEVSRAKLASLEARERRSVQKKIQQLQDEVDLKDNEIETLSNQLEQRGQRIEVLSKVLEQTQQTTKKGLRHTNEDSYLENITKMTEQLSTYEISDRAQKNELVKLHAKVKEAETVTEQLDGAIHQMEELETENRTLKEQIARQGGGGAREQQHGREVTYQSYNQEMMAELSRLRPFEQEVQRLQKELEEAKSFHKDAVLHHSRVITLTTKLSEMEEENRRVRGEYRHLEGSYKMLENEINCLRAQLQAKEAQVGQVVSHRVQRAGGGAAESAEEVSQLRRHLDLKEREISKLKSQLTELASLKPNPQARLKDAAMGQSADEPPPLDLPTDMLELQQLLREKDAKITSISRQLQMFEKTATDLTKIVEHTKGQSRIVKDLRQELARKEGELKKKDNLTAAKDSVQDELERLQKSCTGKETALIATQHENDRLKKEIEQLSRRNAQLDFQLRQLQQRSIAASSQEQKAAHTTAQLDEAVKERNHLEQKAIAQQAKIDNTIQELAQSRRDLTQLTTEVEQLRKEKADLLGEVEAHKITAQVFQEDFQQERKDREKAHSQVAEIEQRYQHQLQSMVEQLDRTTQELEHTKKDLKETKKHLDRTTQELEHTKKDLNETKKHLDRHKDTLSTTETLLHSQLEKLSDRLIEKDNEVAAIGAESEQLRQEVLSKTQQVKQYKKQVDQYKEEVGAFKHQLDIQRQQVERFARESDEWKTKCNKVEAEARKERGMREAFERKTADLEILNDQLQQERNPLPAKPEPPSVARTKGSPPLIRASTSDEPSSRKPPKPQQVQKGYSVDDKRMLNSRGSGTYPHQTPVPRAATDIRAQPHPPSPLVQPGKPALAQSFQFTPADHRGDDFDRPPIPPRTVQPGFGGVPSTGSVASHTHSAGFSGGSGGDFPLTRPYVHGGWEHPSNVAMTGHPPHSQHNVPPVTVGGYHDPQNPIPRGSTRPDAPLGYHYQPQPAQFQKRNAYSSLHPGYPNASPSSLPPMSTVSGEVNSYHKHAHDDSGLYREHAPDIEKDSPPSSNISSQSSQHPESNQQLPHHFGSHRQPAGAASGRQGALPSRFHPNPPRSSQQTYPPPQREPSYRPPMSHAQVSHQPIPPSQFGHHGPNTTSNLLDEPRSRRTHTANVQYPVQETQIGLSPQVKFPPGMRAAASNTIVTSQPNQGVESNRLEVGIEGEIYRAAKDVIKSDSEAPQTLGDEDIPYDPNLICPKCNLNFRIGEIQKYRRHVATCKVGGK